MFRTSNLLQAPEASDCHLDTHFQVFTPLDEHETATGFKTVKGGIIFSTSHGRNFYMNATTFMLERFNPYAVYELHPAVPCPFSAGVIDYATSGGVLIMTVDGELYDLQVPYTKKG